MGIVVSPWPLYPFPASLLPSLCHKAEFPPRIHRILNFFVRDLRLLFGPAVGFTEFWISLFPETRFPLGAAGWAAGPGIRDRLGAGAGAAGNGEQVWLPPPAGLHKVIILIIWDNGNSHFSRKLVIRIHSYFVRNKLLSQKNVPVTEKFLSQKGVSVTEIMWQ